MNKDASSLNLFFKINQLIKKGTIVTIQDANLNENSLKLISKNFTTHYSCPNKGLLILSPKTNITIDYEVHPNNRIQKPIQIDNNKNKAIIINVYGPPTSKIKEKNIFLNELDEFLQDAIEKCPLTDIVVTGDFNISLNNKYTLCPDSRRTE